MESIGPFVTEQLAAWEVPGCAVAAVRDGEIVLAAGWGRRDLNALLYADGIHDSLYRSAGRGLTTPASNPSLTEAWLSLATAAETDLAHA